jgi:hypothetical protein
LIESAGALNHPVSLLAIAATLTEFLPGGRDLRLKARWRKAKIEALIVEANFGFDRFFSCNCRTISANVRAAWGDRRRVKCPSRMPLT